MELRDKNGLTEKEFLDNYKVGDYPRPCVTADILIFSPGKTKQEILLVKRGGHPYINKWALPGGFANPNESVDDAAKRELLEETHIEGLPMEQLGLFSDPGRDPRAWVMTEAYIAAADKERLNVCADDDANDARWFTVCYKKEGENRITLILQSGKITLKALLNINKTKSFWGDKNEISIVDSGEIAFDHAKIILSGILRLEEKGCIK